MIFKVKDGMTITIRRSASVQPLDEITRLSSGTIFEAETAGTPTENTWWVRVLKCEENPAAVSYFGAVVYPNALGFPKIFAEVAEDPTPLPEPDPIVHPIRAVVSNEDDNHRIIIGAFLDKENILHVDIEDTLASQIIVRRNGIEG